MRSASLVFALVAVSGALAQIPPQLQSFIGNLSSSCQQTVLQLAIGSDFSTCNKIPQVLPIVTQALSASNESSLVPYIDQIVSLECATAGCSNSTLTSAYNTLASGCATDLSRYGVSNSTLRTIFQQYPLAREVVCLQTVTPFVANSTTTSSPSTSTSGNATYCATSLLNQVQSIAGTNLSAGFISSLAGVGGRNMTGTGPLAQLARRFNATLLCNDCIFAAANVIGVAYPQIGNVTLRSSGLGSNANVTSGNDTYRANTTIAQALDNTCSARGFSWNSNGTLPSTIRLGAVNSTFGYTLIAGNGTRQAPPNPTPIRRNVANIKARWIGERL